MKTLVLKLINDRRNYLQINSGDIDKALTGSDTQLVIANAKAEQLTDTLYDIYSDLKKTNETVAKIIKNELIKVLPQQMFN